MADNQLEERLACHFPSCGYKSNHVWALVNHLMMFHSVEEENILSVPEYTPKINLIVPSPQNPSTSNDNNDLEARAALSAIDAAGPMVFGSQPASSTGEMDQNISGDMNEDAIYLNPISVCAVITEDDNRKDDIPSDDNESSEEICCSVDIDYIVNNHGKGPSDSAKKADASDSEDEEEDRSTSSDEEEDRSTSSDEDKDRSISSDEDKDRSISSDEDKDRSISSDEDKDRSISSDEDKDRSSSSDEDTDHSSSSDEDTDRSSSSGEDTERCISSDEERERDRFIKMMRKKDEDLMGRAFELPSHAGSGIPNLRPYGANDSEYDCLPGVSSSVHPLPPPPFQQSSLMTMNFKSELPANHQNLSGHLYNANSGEEGQQKRQEKKKRDDREGYRYPISIKRRKTVTGGYVNVEEITIDSD